MENDVHIWRSSYNYVYKNSELLYSFLSEYYRIEVIKLETVYNNILRDLQTDMP